MDTKTQIPVDELIEGRWYVGRGRNANVALWGRIGKNPGRLTFLTIGFKFHQPDVKDEGYYEAESGCFQPFAVIDEGTVVESVGTEPGWPRHYAEVLTFEPGQREDSHGVKMVVDETCNAIRAITPTQPAGSVNDRELRMQLALRAADEMARVCDDWVKRAESWIAGAR